MTGEDNLLRADDRSTASPTAPEVPARLSLIEGPPIEAAAREERAKVFPLWRKIYVVALMIDGAPVKLRRPLKVDVQPGQDMPIIVHAPALDLGGAGRNIDSAVEDLLSTIVLLLQGLAADEDKLAAPAVDVLAKLRALLAK